jgi:hypothetical protein
VRHYVSGRKQMLSDMLQAPGSPLENVRRVVRMWGEMCPESEKGCLMANCLAEFGRTDDKLIDFLNEQILSMQSSFAGALTRARQAGEIDENASVEAIASTLVCTAQGLALMRRSGASGELLRQVVEGTLSLLRAA